MQTIGLNLPGALNLPIDLHRQNGELSPREQTMAELAVKISTTPRLTNGARLDHLRAHDLEETEINAVLKLATVFSYWRERNHLPPPPPQPDAPQAQLRLSLDGDPPYYFEGTYQPGVEGR